MINAQRDAANANALTVAPLTRHVHLARTHPPHQSGVLTDLLAQVGFNSAIVLMAYANKNACYAIKMMALPGDFFELG